MGTSTDLSTTYPSRSDFPLISKVTVANYLRSRTERGLRTRAERPRAGSTSARRYWIVTQYRRGVELLERARVLPVPALPRYPGPLPGVVSWCFTRLPVRTGSQGRTAHYTLSRLGMFMLHIPGLEPQAAARGGLPHERQGSSGNTHGGAHDQAVPKRSPVTA